MLKDFKYYKLLKTYVTRENGNYFKNILYLSDDGKIIKNIKKISKSSFSPITSRQSIQGAFHNFELLLHNLFSLVVNEKSMPVFKLKVKQINYYIEKINKLNKDKNENVSESIKEIVLNSFDMKIKKAPNRNLLKDAFDYMIENTELKNYNIKGDEIEL